MRTCPGCGTPTGAGADTCAGCGDALTGPGGPDPDGPVSDDEFAPVSPEHRFSLHKTPTPHEPGADDEARCPRCGARLPDPDALVCVACLTQLRSREPEGPRAESRPAAGGVDNEAQVLRTRRETAGGHVIIDILDRHVVLPPGRHVIGRDRSSPFTDLLRPLDQISRTHAVLLVDEDGVPWLSDANSTNGTFVEGEELRPGDTVPLGDGAAIRFASDIEATVHRLGVLRGDPDGEGRTGAGW